MKEIRIHGRGGQGAVTAAELLATSAFFDGKFSQAFPSFGSERKGAPVMSFARVDDKKIRTRAQIVTPDYLIVQDSTLLGVVDVLFGLGDDGLAVVNTAKTPAEVGLPTKAKVITVNATQIAVEELGRPIPNTVMIGAFAGATGLVTIESVEKAVRERFPGELGEKNAKACRRAYEAAKEAK
ncbi:MAG TPA: pyruvate ferredoxin oxidoreductase subunit gamma [Caldisericia bacterium]|nr:pyruvate ferredoxin oxidoreductase subunit gamma [Caldisericia bacterium]HPF49538.1 pyruvate ferredoxin oxidoreductase subunit gamma [Caldisericia bacterium]HPI84168.1 pyruvate ferredoxin oxidoreductase subunit gamma [Caldisericia bacterium]HPQ93537.1 pyruvate ferredoxin oxidoreductase subunit gamma [Caldisericia bacterium]HRV75457.1 pyruvate ferredoxin oxidoreductase subunit gamma [Caldisericia bacterium]